MCPWRSTTGVRNLRAPGAEGPDQPTVRRRAGDGHRVRTDLPSPVRADDPVRVEEREVPVARNGVDVPASEVRGLRLDDPVLPAEVQVRVLEPDARRVGEGDRPPAPAAAHGPRP